MTASVSASTFNTALQQGQVTSNAAVFFAIHENDTAKGRLLRRELDGKYVKYVQHF